MATANFAASIAGVVAELARNRVQFLVVGGTAAFHGYIRHTTTGDGQLIDVDNFDFWYIPTHPNYRHLLKACTSLGLDVSCEMDDGFPNPHKSFFRFKMPDFTLDFLPEVTDKLKFMECFKRRHISTIYGREVPVISLEDLIVCKIAAG